MNITIIGSGYVGLVSGVCFANIGHNVTCIDKDGSKIAALKNGQIPIFEPGLAELLNENKPRIEFSTDLATNLEKSDAVFIAVGTPQDEDGSADMSYVLAAAKEINELSNQIGKKDLVIVTKSTVPVGTADRIREIVDGEVKVASNPEFLREGNAIDDFMNPDRIVIGCDDERSEEVLTRIYEPLNDKMLVRVSTRTAEMIKYVSNAFLATKIGFINEIANLCEKTGADIEELAVAVGLDSRIGEKFLKVGPGFGGSCFPKDVSAILNIAKNENVDLSIVDATKTSNEARKNNMAKRILDQLGGKKTVAVFGLAFKANTDDIRYSPAISIVRELLKAGVNIRASDFEAIENTKKELAQFSNIEYFDDVYEAAKGADLLAILTEWPEYKDLNLNKLKDQMSGNLICDLRNMLDKKTAQDAGLDYDYIGNYYKK